MTERDEWGEREEERERERERERESCENLCCQHALIIIIIIITGSLGFVGSVFATGPGDLGSTPGRVIPKTFKMVLDTSLLNTQPYKVRIKGKVEKSRERSSVLPYTAV